MSNSPDYCPMERCRACQGNRQLEGFLGTEWGVPVHDDQTLFGLLVMESMQAGLSRKIALAREDAYRERFFEFDVQKVAELTAVDVAELMQDERLIRNIAKMKSIPSNARAFCHVQEAFGSFDAYLHDFEANLLYREDEDETADEVLKPDPSLKFVRSLKNFGFVYIGPKIAKAFLQAIGMLPPQDENCPYALAAARAPELQSAGA